jgi:PAS domain S-box-containing protein
VTATDDLATRLERAERQLADAQQLARVGSWEWDVPNNVVWWSDELYRIYGLQPRSIVPSYEDFLERVHPDDRAGVDARNQKAFADHEPFEDVKRVVRADGREILMRTQGAVVCDDAGQPLRMVGICEDVTDAESRRRARELNDQVIQALVVAGFHLERGDLGATRGALTEARLGAQRIASDLLLDTGIEPGSLRLPGAAKT